MTSLDQYRPEKSTVLPNSAGIERMFANMKKEQDVIQISVHFKNCTPGELLLQEGGA